jgi:hypothetical protein
LRQVFICLRPRTPYPPHIVFMYTVYLFTQERGGRGGGDLFEPERRLEGQQFIKLV